MVKNKLKVAGIVVILIMVLSVVFFVLSLFTSYITANDMIKTLNNIKNESDYIPVVAVSGKVYMDDNIYNLYECIKDYNEDYQFAKALCVYNNRFYIHVHGDNKTEYIASIGMEKMDLSIHSQIGDIDYAKFTNECVAYNDGIITITNGVNVLEYDILKNKSKIFQVEDYNFVEESMDYSVSVQDSEKIELKHNGESYIFDFSEIAQSSIGASKLYSYKTKKTWSGDSRFDGLYVSDSWSIVDNRIYVVVKCMSFDGTLLASIIEYDYDENKWVYVSGGYECGGAVEGDYFFKIVPTF